MMLDGEVLVALVQMNRQLPIQERRLILGCRPDGQLVSNDLSMSYLIGGQPGMGKTTIAAWLCCMMVIVGAQLLVIDPHCHHEEESLLSKIEPLTPWFAAPPVDFEEMRVVVNRFRWLGAEYQRRKRSMRGKRPLFVIIDEFNELLSELSPADHKLVVEILSNVIRGGRKHGIVVCLIAQNWDLSSTGGRQIRTTIGCKIATDCDPSEMKLILNLDDSKEVASLYHPSLRKGEAYVKRPGFGRIKLCYPETTSASSAAVADLVQQLTAEGEKAVPLLLRVPHEPEQ